MNEEEQKMPDFIFPEFSLDRKVTKESKKTDFEEQLKKSLLEGTLKTNIRFGSLKAE